MGIHSIKPAPYRPATVVHPPRPVYVLTEPDYSPAAWVWVVFLAVLWACAIYAFDSPTTWEYLRPQ